MQSYNAQRTAEFDAKMKVTAGKGIVAEPRQNGVRLASPCGSKKRSVTGQKIETYQMSINAETKEGLTACTEAAMISQDDTMLKYLLAIHWGEKRTSESNFRGNDAKKPGRKTSRFQKQCHR